MNTVSMLIAALVVLPAVGLVVCARFAMSEIEEELQDVTRFDGVHFEI